MMRYEQSDPKNASRVGVGIVLFVVLLALLGYAGHLAVNESLERDAEMQQYENNIKHRKVVDTNKEQG